MTSSLVLALVSSFAAISIFLIVYFVFRRVSPRKDESITSQLRKVEEIMEAEESEGDGTR